MADADYSRALDFPGIHEIPKLPTTKDLHPVPDSAMPASRTGLLGIVAQAYKKLTGGTAKPRNEALGPMALT
jgi:hypothetical protein